MGRVMFIFILGVLFSFGFGIVVKRMLLLGVKFSFVCLKMFFECF